MFDWEWLCTVFGHRWGSPVTVKPKKYDLTNTRVERVKTCLRCGKQHRYVSTKLARWAE